MTKNGNAIMLCKNFTVGIDWGYDELYIAVINSDGDVIALEQVKKKDLTSPVTTI